MVVPPKVSWTQRLAVAEEHMGKRTRALLSTVIGLWPVTAVVMLACGLLWASVMAGSP